MNLHARLRAVAIFATWLGVAGLVFAQSFPSRPVKITAPYSAGAAPAVFTRSVAEKLSKLWGQPVIVDAKPGASGFIAIEAVKNAAPDGHELLVVSDAHVAINPALYKKLPYDPQKDFVPVAMFYHTPFYLAVATCRAVSDRAGAHRRREEGPGRGLLRVLVRGQPLASGQRGIRVPHRHENDPRALQGSIADVCRHRQWRRRLGLHDARARRCR